MADLEERFEIFSAFRLGMIEFFSNDLAEDGMRHRKSSISHRIALRLRPFFPMQYTIDIDTDGADILVWKDDEIPLAIFWSEEYLTEKEKKKAIEYHREKSPGLTLAFSLLHDRSWILIYRFGDDYVEYLHIDKYTFDENVIKRLIIPEKAKDDGQLMLSLRPERKRERRKAEAITQDQ